MGKIGVLTWNGHDKHHEDGNKEGILIIFFTMFD